MSEPAVSQPALTVPSAAHVPHLGSVALGEVEFPPGLPLEVVDRAEGRIAWVDSTNPGAYRERLEQQGVNLLAFRHGQSEANALTVKYAEPVLAGRTDAPLTAQGVRQARSAGASLYEELGGDAWLLRAVSEPAAAPVLMVSPLQRTAQTAQQFIDFVLEQARRLVAAGQVPPQAVNTLKVALAPTVDPRLIEMNYGELELQPMSAFAQRLPEFRTRWDSFTGEGIDYLGRFPGGENRLDVLRRTSAAVRDIAQKYPHRTVVLYTHLEAMVGLQLATGNASLRHDGSVQVMGLRIPNASLMHLTGPKAVGLQPV